MIVIISNTDDRAYESQLIQQLLDAGLDKFHIRKPSQSFEEVNELVDKISSKYHHRLVIHEYHQLLDTFPGLNAHFKSMNRKQSDKGYSTSVHSMNELETCFDNYDFLFCSPVFDSISKKGYNAKQEWHGLLNPMYADKMIALGGIDKSKLHQLKDWGYKNIALLGSIWQSADPVMTFKEIKEEWES